MEAVKKYFLTNMTDYVEEVVSLSGGLSFFREREVFIADSRSRIALNAFPELMQFVEQVCYEQSKGMLLSCEYDLGPRNFTNEVLDEHESVHIKTMYKANLAVLYYGLRNYLANNDIRDCDTETSALKALPDTMERVCDMHINGPNQMVERLKESGVFERRDLEEVGQLQQEIIAAVGEFIIEHVGFGDRETYLDLIKTRFLLD